jgi:hypothetical protein
MGNWQRPFALVGLLPDEKAAKEVIQSAIRNNKELRPDVDLDQALDALYGGFTTGS